MDENLAKFRDTIVESAGDLANSLGLNRVVGQLYALLYISSSPMSLDKMLDLLEISKGNVSVNIRVLENWGAVRKVWVKGSRKDYYEANRDITGIALTRLKSGLTNRINKMNEIVNQAETLLSSSDTGNTSDEKKIYQERLGEIKELSGKISGFLSLFSPEMAKNLINSKH
jgi:DNA-binding transcriptional regulator GbsR (MarR family)